MTRKEKFLKEMNSASDKQTIIVKYMYEGFTAYYPDILAPHRENDNFFEKWWNEEIFTTWLPVKEKEMMDDLIEIENKNLFKRLWQKLK